MKKNILIGILFQRMKDSFEIHAHRKAQWKQNKQKNSVQLTKIPLGEFWGDFSPIQARLISKFQHYLCLELSSFYFLYQSKQLY